MGNFEKIIDSRRHVIAKVIACFVALILTFSFVGTPAFAGEEAKTLTDATATETTETSQNILQGGPQNYRQVGTQNASQNDTQDVAQNNLQNAAQDNALSSDNVQELDTSQNNVLLSDKANEITADSQNNQNTNQTSAQSIEATEITKLNIIEESISITVPSKNSFSGADWTCQLHADVDPDGTEIAWSSSNVAIATVDQMAELRVGQLV